MSEAALNWYQHVIVGNLSIADLWMLAGPLVAGLVAATMTHVLSGRRDLTNHKLRLDYEAEVAARSVRREKLLDAYQALDASEPQRVEVKGLSTAENVELLKMRVAAYSDIGLFGCEKLVEQLDKIVKEPRYDTSILMNLLRDQLRTEYGLELTVARYKWVDVNLKPLLKKQPEKESP